MLKIIKEYYAYFKEKRYDTLAGSLSFFFILCFVPLLYLCLSLAIKLGQLWGIEVDIPNIISEYISFDINAGVSILFILVTIYSSSVLLNQLRKTGEIIYGLKKPKSPLKYQALSCALTILMIIVVALSLIIATVIHNFLEDKTSAIIIRIVTILIVIALIIGFVILVNRYATVKKRSWKELWKGIIFTIIFMALLSLIFFLYVFLIANYQFLYGFFSTIIIAFLYIYLMMRGIICGVIINQKNYTDN